MEDLRALFEHEVRDLYSAETQMLKAFPELQKHAHDEDLRGLLDEHMKETANHKKRIELICKELNMQPSGEECKAMEGILDELKKFLRKDMEKEVKDAGLIAEAQRAEHYEISGYGTAARFAQELGLDEISKKLHETLEEEKRADQKLNQLAEGRLNREAKR